MIKQNLASPARHLFFALMALWLLSGCSSKSSNSTENNSTGAAGNNTATVTAGFGPNGQAGGFVNGLFTNIKICQPSTQNCVMVDNVLVDTGSVGLRLVSPAVGSITLNAVSDNGNPLAECVQYGDTSYSWGEVALAEVQIAGETAPSVPVQIIGQTPTNNAPASCLRMPVNPNLPNGGNEDTLALLGANGILGIGNGGSDGPWDCGSYCTGNTAFSPYYTCPNGACAEATAPLSDQSENPIAAFSSSDTNGLIITLPAVAATGSTTASGTMRFGIGTQSDNALSSGATLYAMDQCNGFQTVTFNSVNYTDGGCTRLGGFLDTGSNGFFVSDATALASFGISDCPGEESGFYCVSGAAGTTSLSNISLVGNGNVGSGTVTLNIENATTLFTTNNAVFDDLAGDSGTGPANDFFDFGLPFFLGRTVFIGITGTNGTTSGSFASNAPYGFVAF